MIKDNRTMSLARGIGRGYLRVGKSAVAVLLTLAAVAAISAIIVTPLWFLATRYDRLYTIISVCGLAAALLVPLIVRLTKDSASRKLFFRRLLRVLLFLGLAVSLYFIVLLYAWGFLAIAIPLTVIIIIVAGLIFHGKRTTQA